MAYNYDGYVTQLCNLMVVSSGDANFQNQLPGFIDYAEQRIYRELDLVDASVTDATGALTGGQRLAGLSTSIGQFIVVDEINVITPSTASAATGTRTQLIQTARSFIDLCYPSNASGQAVPRYWSIVDSSTIIVGPPPDANYPIEVIGTQRPTPLSSANSSTFLTNFLPDLFMAASMVYASGYLKNYGAMVDDPQQPGSWEAQYQKLKASADLEEMRKKYEADAWTSNAPSPVAMPPRS